MANGWGWRPETKNNFFRSARDILIDVIGWAGIVALCWGFWLFSPGYQWQVF